jgi:hypothetical protein
MIIFLGALAGLGALNATSSSVSTHPSGGKVTSPIPSTSASSHGHRRPPGRYHPAPSVHLRTVVHFTDDVATLLLEGDGFMVLERRVVAPNEQVLTVIRSKPAAGTRLRRGSTIRLLVAVGIYRNPWGYAFARGLPIYDPPADFCQYFPCIPYFPHGVGYVVQCRDGWFSRSGGRPNVCSYHGGERRALFLPRFGD